MHRHPSNLQPHSGTVQKQGFTLLVTLLVISLLLMLALTFFAIIKNELRAILNKESLLKAQSSARVGIMIALDGLQTQLGPDQRVSANADILTSRETIPDENAFYLGSWDVSEDDSLEYNNSNVRDPDTGMIDPAKVSPTWHVSMSDGTTPLDVTRTLDSYATSPEDLIEFHHDPNRNIRIKAMKRDLPEPASARLESKTAWWVSDEGVKHRIEASPDILETWETSSQGTTEQLRLLQSAHNGMEGLIPSMTDPYRNDAELAKLTSIKQAELISDLPTDWARDNMLDATLYSQSVLSDTKNGGLKIDLTNAFEHQWKEFLAFQAEEQGLPDDRVSDWPWPQVIARVPGPDGYSPGDPYDDHLYGPYWDILYSYYNLHKPYQPWLAGIHFDYRDEITFDGYEDGQPKSEDGVLGGNTYGITNVLDSSIGNDMDSLIDGAGYGRENLEVAISARGSGVGPQNNPFGVPMGGKYNVTPDYSDAWYRNNWYALPKTFDSQETDRGTSGSDPYTKLTMKDRKEPLSSMINLVPIRYDLKIGLSRELIPATAEDPNTPWNDTFEGYRLQIHLIPQVVFWNPYNSSVVTAAASIQSLFRNELQIFANDIPILPYKEALGAGVYDEERGAEIGGLAGVNYDNSDESPSPSRLFVYDNLPKQRYDGAGSSFYTGRVNSNRALKVKPGQLVTVSKVESSEFYEVNKGNFARTEFDTGLRETSSYFHLTHSGLATYADSDAEAIDLLDDPAIISSLIDLREAAVEAGSPGAFDRIDSGGAPLPLPDDVNVLETGTVISFNLFPGECTIEKNSSYYGNTYPLGDNVGGAAGGFAQQMFNGGGPIRLQYGTLSPNPISLGQVQNLPAFSPTTPGQFLHIATISWQMKATSDTSDNIPTFSQFNPRAINHSPFLSQGSLGGSEMFAPTLVDPTNQPPDWYPISSSGTNGSYWGASYQENTPFPGAATPNIILYDVPRQPLHSLGHLMHANVSFLATQPSYAIGNSFTAPYVEPENFRQTLSRSPDNLGNPSLTKVVMDWSYVLNDALWDTYFFSTVPPDYTNTSAIGGDATLDLTTLVPPFETVDTDYIEALKPLPNTSHRYFFQHGDDMVENLSDLRDFQTAAANLMVDGGFNINSTSVPAWKAFLSQTSFFEDPLEAMEVDSDATTDTTTIPEEELRGNFNRFSILAGDDENNWTGYRRLDDTELQSLAEAIVDQVKERGPFLSLSDFVNRRLTDEPSGEMGPLQQAIEDADLNDRMVLEDEPTSSGFVTQSPYMNGGLDRDLMQPTAMGIPGSIIQNDILFKLAPKMTARSDTFKIMGYGEVVNPTTNTIESYQYCEAVVQRIPNFLVDPDTAPGGAGDAPETHPDDLTDLVNGSYGRNFRIVNFRWLSPEDLSL